MKNIEVLSALCRIISRLSGPLRLLYQSDMLDGCLRSASINLPGTITAIKAHLVSLRIWHDDTIEKFPFPVSLDDVHETLCIYVNMLFIYHASMKFALHMHLVLIHESFAASHALFHIEDSHRELQAANTDLGRRFQELVQLRVMKDLPTTATPFLAPPLILQVSSSAQSVQVLSASQHNSNPEQAINVTASRGLSTESNEARHLDIFTRTLKSQRSRYDGSEFLIDVLNNVISYARQNEDLTTSMNTWRKSSSGDDGPSNGDNSSEDDSRQNPMRRLDWNTMVRKQPKLLLRLMFHLDYALRTWGVPQENNFPPSLRRTPPAN